MPHALSLRSILSLTLALLFFAGGCESFEGEKILAYKDPDTGLNVDVFSQMRGGKTRVHMEVTRDDKTRRLVIADGLQMHNASLIRFNQWLLVLAGPYVLGGYDIDGDRLVAMNSDALPFTVRGISGYVVDEKQIGTGDDAPPINFRERTDPRN